jgi:hypothetical protein
LERKSFALYQSPEDLGLALAEGRSEAFQAMQSIGHVRTSFYNWLGSKEYLLYRRADLFFIGWQPRLNSDFETIKLLLGLPAAVKLPAGRRAHGKPPGYDPNLSDAAQRAVCSWYRKDYELLAFLQSEFNFRHTAVACREEVADIVP